MNHGDLFEEELRACTRISVYPIISLEWSIPYMHRAWSDLNPTKSSSHWPMISMRNCLLNAPAARSIKIGGGGVSPCNLSCLTPSNDLLGFGGHEI